MPQDYCFFCVVLEDPAALLGELLLGELELGLELELEPLEDDDLSLEELGVDDEPEELGLLLLGELDIEPDEDPDAEPDGEDGLAERLEPEAPVVELAPRSQP